MNRNENSLPFGRGDRCVRSIAGAMGLDRDTGGGQSSDGLSTNSFFLPPSAGTTDRRSRRRGIVYAAIEVPEPNEEPASGYPAEPVYLECVDFDWFHDFSVDRATDVLNENWRYALVSVLELKSYPLPNFPVDARPGDIVWYQFGYEPASVDEGDAILYMNLFSGGEAVKISFHEPRQINWISRGSRGESRPYVDLAVSRNLRESAMADVRSWLANVECSGGVALYDVGQGACQAALSPDRHIPTLYIDFGGGVLANRGTFPIELAKFCFSNRPMIVLSHWDWDHWSSAYRQEEALDTLWLAPPVPAKPIQLAVAADLYSRGVLAIWDGSWPGKISADSVQIERGTGRTSNDSGLVVTLKPTSTSKRSCLLPGDCDYAHIPSVQAGTRFSSLAMTHHGGRLHSSAYPKSKRPGASGLSVGQGNSYKHPFFSTLTTHGEKGWGLPLATATSGQRPCHVLLPWGKPPVAFIGGCHGSECNVAISALMRHLPEPIQLAPTNVARTSKAKAEVGT